MKTLTIRIEANTMEALRKASQQFVDVWKSGVYAGEVLSFESLASLFQLLTPARWDMLYELQRGGHCDLGELAQRLGHDASTVHRDVTALLERGLIEKDENNRLYVPFDRIHTEFDIAKAV